MTTIAHKVYYWVETRIENEYKIFQPKDIAYRHGVPAKELFTYWQKEIDCDKAVQTLPRTLFLIIFFALMLLSHEMIGPAQSIERAIRFDIEENANFAFNGVGTFGNKNIQDVNSFADFYSWFRLGFAAIYMPQSTSVSEGSTLTAVPLSTPNKQIYLETNRKLGPIKLSQQKVTKASQCDNYNLFQAIDAGVTADSCAALGKDFFIQPTDFDIGFLDFTEDMNATIWFSPMEDATPLITWLENSTWLTSDTDHWKITMVLYNPDFDILTVTGIHFLLARSGRIWKQITFMSLKMAPYANLWPLCWEILFFGSIFTIFIEEVYEVVSGLLATRVRGRCKCVSFFREYISVWNLIDWVSIILAFTLLGMWILTCEDRKALQVAVEALIATCSSADQNTCQEYQEYVLDLASDAGQLAGQTSLVSSFYPFCILLRLFKTFSLQPRLAVVTRTLWASFADLAHFGIIFLSVFVTFVFMAMGFFGRTVEGYSSFHIAFVTLFRALMGDLDFDAMEEQAGRVIAGIFHLAFMLTMLLILLNMLIAIIMDVYAETKRNASCSDTVWDDVVDYFQRLWHRRTGTRISISKAKALFIASLEQEAEDKETEAPHLQKLQTSVFGDDVKESDIVVTIADLMRRVPEMPPEQATESIEQSVVWFERVSDMEIDQQEMLQGIRQLQQAAGIELNPAGHSRQTLLKQDEAPMVVVDQAGVDQHLKAQEIAKTMDLKHLLLSLQMRLDEFEKPSRARDLLAQMVASVRMVEDEKLVDIRL